MVVNPITDTQLKLRDAGIQMKLALKNIGSEDIFRSCVSAYIAAARSILDVMKQESSGDSELLVWYETQVTALKKLPIARFFNQQRELTIHRGTVKLQSHSAPIWNMLVNGEKLPGQGTMSVWVFDNVQKYITGDSGNVPRLCEQYFLILKKLVHDWLAQKAATSGKER
jgi:hypothetical protein